MPLGPYPGLRAPQLRAHRAEQAPLFPSALSYHGWLQAGVTWDKKQCDSLAGMDGEKGP